MSCLIGARMQYVEEKQKAGHELFIWCQKAEREREGWKVAGGKKTATTKPMVNIMIPYSYLQTYGQHMIEHNARKVTMVMYLMRACGHL